MTLTSLLAALLLAALPLGLCHLVWRRMERVRLLPRRLAYLMLGGGVVLGMLAAYVEPLALDWMELSFQAGKVGSGPALSAMLLMAAPLEEALKALVVWPLYVRRQLLTARLGLAAAMCAGAGFAAGEAVVLALHDPLDLLGALRILALGPAHLFFAGAWGFALGAGRGGRDRWFPLAWIVAVVLHGLYDHLMLARGPALLWVALPLLGFMFGAAWVVLRSVAPESDSADASSKLSLLSPPSLSDMRRALARKERPLMLHWIALGALVTLGVVIASLAGAIYLGHRLGIDF
ncbi:MAG TPA: PrsW family glutamic-type intramembrane protease, partial [Polyangiaceae bacterium]|nr:PrsW family glutamic-type intramembrane protease [Polyangiaceae bacterium]